MRFFVNVAAAAAACIAVAGCQGTPVGDAMIGKEKLAAMDDSYCQSIGAKPGSDAYVQCRMFKTGQREQNHRAAFARAGAGLATAGAGMQNQAQMNRPTNCTITPHSTFVGGAPSSYTTSCQ